MNNKGKTHIMVKKGSIVSVGRPVLHTEAGEGGFVSYIADYVNEDHVLTEDICVFVEADNFSTICVDSTPFSA